MVHFCGQHSETNESSDILFERVSVRVHCDSKVVVFFVCVWFRTAKAILTLHRSPGIPIKGEYECVCVQLRRCHGDCWVDLDNPPPPHANERHEFLSCSFFCVCFVSLTEIKHPFLHETKCQMSSFQNRVISSAVIELHFFLLCFVLMFV